MDQYNMSSYVLHCNNFKENFTSEYVCSNDTEVYFETHSQKSCDINQINIEETLSPFLGFMTREILSVKDVENNDPCLKSEATHEGSLTTLEKLNENITKLSHNIGRLSNDSQRNMETNLLNENCKDNTELNEFEHISKLNQTDNVSLQQDLTTIVILETPVKNRDNQTLSLNEDIYLPIQNGGFTSYRSDIPATSHSQCDILLPPPNINLLTNLFEISESYPNETIDVTTASSHVPFNENSPSLNEQHDVIQNDVYESKTPLPLCEKLTPKESTPQMQQKLISMCNVVQEFTPTTTSNYATNEMFQNDYSPEMFSEDESADVYSTSSNSIKQLPLTDIPKQTSDSDRILLKRLQESLTGVLPPPSVTMCQMNVNDLLNKINEHSHFFLSSNDDQVHDFDTQKRNSARKSLLVQCSEEEVTSTSWPDIQSLRFHGVHYNRSTVSEDVEHFCQRYAERFVGNETASTCTVWPFNIPSSATKKRKLQKQLGAPSPSRRLSHLARRRITFSKENISAKNCVVSNLSLNRSRQILMDIKKTDLGRKRKLSPQKNSPRKKLLRKTPSKCSPRKKIRTPLSSAKKRAARRLLVDAECKPSTSIPSINLGTSKRALFQSPERALTNSKIETSLSTRAVKTKRALFSTTKRDTTPTKKRKWTESDVGSTSTQPEKHSKTSTNDTISHSRRLSSTQSQSDFSDLHKKKMLWAISEALRTQNVGMSHPNFKLYAAALARIIKHQMPDLILGGPRQPGSTSERMSKIARQHAFAVIKGQSVEQIIAEIPTATVTSTKLKGYVAPPSENMENDVPNSATAVTVTRAEYTLPEKATYKRQIKFDNFGGS